MSVPTAVPGLPTYALTILPRNSDESRGVVSRNQPLLLFGSPSTLPLAMLNQPALGLPLTVWLNPPLAANDAEPVFIVTVRLKVLVPLPSLKSVIERPQ